MTHGAPGEHEPDRGGPLAYQHGFVRSGKVPDLVGHIDHSVANDATVIPTSLQQFGRGGQSHSSALKPPAFRILRLELLGPHSAERILSGWRRASNLQLIATVRSRTDH
jgi:hypothetical protein